MPTRWTPALLLSATLLAPSPGIAADHAPPPGEPLDIVWLSPEMKSFIEARVRRNAPRSVRVQRLLDALFGRDGLDIVYGNVETRTAAETFASRSGNCLSFTILFVALARHVGLEAHFQEVSEILSWDRRGDVAVSNRHMFAEVVSGDGLVRVDFLPGVEKRYRSVRRVDERRVLAHYYSNLGAEALTQSRPERALELFEQALAADDTLAAAWVNKGVTHRRLGDVAAAESCYLRAIELNPGEISAAANLAVLYRASGRERKAAPYQRQVRRFRRSNPFYHFRSGLEAAERGDLEAAISRLKKAVRLLPNDVMFRVELGKLQRRAGQPARAERSFRRALQRSADDAERRRVQALIEGAGAGP